MRQTLYVMQIGVLVLEITFWCWSILNLTEDTSVSNQVNPDEVNLTIVKCPVCDFNIEVSTGRDRSVDYDAYNMVWPPEFYNLCLAELIAWSISLSFC